MIEDQHLDAFRVAIVGRENNDKMNKLREEVIVNILNWDAATRLNNRKFVRDKTFFDHLVYEIDKAVESLSDFDREFSPDLVIGATPRGGRRFNYDFLINLKDEANLSGLKVELKRGVSIFDQPQFLSVYVKSPGVTRASYVNYAEFFYINYFQVLQNRTQCPHMSKSFYLSNVFGTEYEEKPFGMLYQFAKGSNQNRKFLSELQHQSIDKYLRKLLSDSSNIDFEALQSRLYTQLEKIFLSWDPIKKSFTWEKFSKKELTLSGKAFPKSRKNGQVSTVVLPTETHQEIQMLLRWKNNPCVKGPAWQIRLTPPQP